MNRNRTFMLYFVFSEAFFFLALIIAYVYYSHPGGKLSDTAKYLEIGKASVFTVFLLLSSLTIEFAAKKKHNGEKKPLLFWLLTTFILGGIFLVGQATEYLKLISANVTISRDVFGSAFFTLTGFHGFHVLIGLIIIMIVLLMLTTGKYKSIESTAFDSATIYWHFVDAVWIVVFSVVYIGPLI